MTVQETGKDIADRATGFASDTLAAASHKLHDATDQLRDAAGSARVAAGETLSAAREKVAGAYEAARDTTGSAYEAAREKTANAAEIARERASTAYASARETASTVRTRTATGIEESPIAAVVGGIAVGVLLGALLPRTRREAEALGPVSDKLAALARDALAAAKDAGQDTLDELGINKDAARDQVNRLIDGATKVATSAGTAAAETIREPRS